MEEWFYYGKCMKNHAVAVGRTVMDGCGEFWPKEDSPESLLCTVCDCHRNFHQKILFSCSSERREEPAPAPAPVQPEVLPEMEETEGQEKVKQDEMMGAVSAVSALPAPNAVEAAREERQGSHEVRRKGRTLFTAEQKARMRAFADELGWRMVRERSGEIDIFCHQIGVPRQSFKLWMQNHKRSTVAQSIQ